MPINRHNYEEFLLMYVDNELNLHQRMELELFIEQNPDLAAELTALQEAVLMPEPQVTFTGKESLFKQENGQVTPENCEEQFLLYIDNELDIAGKAQVESFLLQHPQQQAQFNLLQQTVLVPEPVVFANKQVLYRKEKERRVIPFAWTRLAVAAALLGVTATAGWWFFYGDQSESGKPGIAVTTPTTVPSEKTAGTNKQPATTVPDAGTQQPTEGPQAHSGTEQLINPAQQPVIARAKRSAQQAQTNTGNSTATALPAPSNTGNQAALAENMNIAKLPATVTIPATQSQTVQAAPHLPDQNLVTPAVQRQQAAAVPEKQQDTYKTIAYKELDTSEEDQSIYVGALELNRNKVKGIFKKAGRLLGARAKAATEENL